MDSSNVQLSFLHDDLTRKLKNIESIRENQEALFQTRLAESQEKINFKIQKCLQELQSNIHNFISFTRGTDNAEQQETIADYFLHEEKFTAALTSYTKKQFFEGIAELAGTSDTCYYGLLDIRKPESLLIKGQTEEINERDRTEAQRLQSLYANSERKRIDAQLKSISLKSAAETAEKQLQLIDSGYFDKFEIKDLRNDISKITNESSKTEQTLSKKYESELLPLLNDLQELQFTKILQGNYNLKISRQDYILSKQKEVINQLLQQCSRNHFLEMLNEIKLKDYRSYYHLIASAKLLIQREVESLSKRINYLSDPLLTSSSKKEVITPRDAFGSKIYDVIVGKTDGNELYKSYQKLAEESSTLSSTYSSLKKELTMNAEELESQIQLVESTLKEIGEQYASDNHLKSSQELPELINNLEENLGLAEVEINDVIKDIVEKRKIIATDRIKDLERSLFPMFFNDPSRLKRTLDQLESQVKAYMTNG